jgi:hypothetical protein
MRPVDDKHEFPLVRWGTICIAGEERFESLDRMRICYCEQPPGPSPGSKAVWLSNENALFTGAWSSRPQPANGIRNS